MMSCWPGDKTASVMTSWTTKGLNSRRRRRRLMEYRSFAWAATAVAADDRGGANTRKIYAKQMFVLRVIRTLTLCFK